MMPANSPPVQPGLQPTDTFFEIGALPKQRMDETLGAQVLAHLRAQLITGMLAPGDKLSLRTLALQLGVSVQPVRYAVARLAAEHALVVTPKRSFQVPLMSLPQFRELTAIRQAIEGFAVEHAARRRGGPEFAESKTIFSFCTGCGIRDGQ